MAYTPVNSALLEQLIAANALTQLNRVCVYPKVAVRDYEPGAFERGESVKIRRPKRRVAQDLNPRVGGATFTEGDFFQGTVSLQRLWTDGYPIYGHDPSQAIDKYVVETAAQIADAIGTPNDDYMYSAFRDWSSLASTGSVALGDAPPIKIVASVDSTGQISKMGNAALRAAETALDKENVPSSNRYCVLSSTAKGDFIGDALVVSDSISPLAINQGQLVTQGLPLGQFVPRYTFNVAGSNAVQGQVGVTDLDTASSSQATLPIASVTANTAFTYADYAATTYLGAVDITLTAGTALQNVGVGQIARIGGSNYVKAFGVILRINTTTPTAPVITLVPCDPSGNVLAAAQITAGTDVFSIPSIGSVNTVNHLEGLLMANRFIREPSVGSGARAASITDPDTNLVIQIFSGQYDLTRVREINAGYMLTGTKISDFRKTALILSN